MNIIQRKRGLFITLEGPEGGGKSTQAEKLGGYLRQKGFDVILTIEPGGTEVGNKIRELLLFPDYRGMDEKCELLLYMARKLDNL